MLIVASYNKGSFAPFIIDQVDALRKIGVECEYFGIKGKGVVGYLSEIHRLKEEIVDFCPDIIHAHYGLSGLLSNFQNKVPVVTTYHGSDINNPKVLLFSRISILLSDFNIFVSQNNIDRVRVRHKYTLMPCGVDLKIFNQISREEARARLGWGRDDKIALFAGAFDNPVKNASLAWKAINMIDGVKLLELKGFSREEVALRMNAANVLLMTSLSEGSPQVIKEALACGCPIVSVDIGDVKEVINGICGCFLSNNKAECIAEGINKAILFLNRTSGRTKIEEMGLSNIEISLKLKEIYSSVVNNHRI